MGVQPIELLPWLYPLLLKLWTCCLVSSHHWQVYPGMGKKSIVFHFIHNHFMTTHRSKSSTFHRVSSSVAHMQPQTGFVLYLVINYIDRSFGSQQQYCLQRNIHRLKCHVTEKAHEIFCIFRAWKCNLFRLEKNTQVRMIRWIWESSSVKGRYTERVDFQMNPSETVECFNLVENENNFFPSIRSLKESHMYRLTALFLVTSLKLTLFTVAEDMNKMATQHFGIWDSNRKWKVRRRHKHQSSSFLLFPLLP